VPKYLFLARHTPQGAKGLIDEGGTSRRAATEHAVGSVGGKLEAFYYAFGDTDVFIIADLPDHAAAASLSLAVGATGGIKTETVVLLTPEELDAAASKQPAYRPPGSGS
jgi:uncharacterized protein with GYD domain